MKTKILAGILSVLMLASCMSLASCGGQTGVADDGTFDFETSDLSKYLTLGEYKGLTAQVENEKEIQSADVDKELRKLVEDNAVEGEHVTDRGLAADDIANIDFVGRIDGVAFENGSDSDFDLKIGSNTFIPGFESGMIGMTQGEVRNVPVTMPDYYDEELAGKQAIFEVTLNYIHSYINPEYNDELVKAHTDYETMAEYEASLYETLQSERDAENKTAVENSLWTQIMDASEIIEYPAGMVDEYVSGAVAYYKDTATSYNMEYADFLNRAYSMTEDEMNEALLLQAQNFIKQELVIYSVCRKENVTISDEEYQKGLVDFAAAQGYDTLDAFLTAAQYTEDDIKDTVRIGIFLDKASELVKGYSAGVEYGYEPPVETTAQTSEAAQG